MSLWMLIGNLIVWLQKTEHSIREHKELVVILYVCMCWAEEGLGVTGSEGISCLREKVKEWVWDHLWWEIDKWYLVINVVCLSLGLYLNYWLYPWQPHCCVWEWREQRKNLKANNNRIVFFIFFFRTTWEEFKCSHKSFRLRVGGWLGAADSLSHPCHRQLVHEGQLLLLLSHTETIRLECPLVSQCIGNLDTLDNGEFIVVSNRILCFTPEGSCCNGFFFMDIQQWCWRLTNICPQRKAIQFYRTSKTLTIIESKTKKDNKEIIVQTIHFSDYPLGYLFCLENLRTCGQIYGF